MSTTTPASGRVGSASPFHAGELEIQQRVGVREQMDGAGRNNVRDYMPDQHRQFFGELPFFFIGALDGTGQPWATMLAGEPGFIATPDARTMTIAGGMLAGDPLQGQLHAGDYVGGLGLVPATRRRNRVNGMVEAIDGGAMRIAVLQSFGNCPQYIQDRQHSAVPDREHRVQVLRGVALTQQDRELIARADTFFIASAHVGADAGRGRGVDVSHRGGRPGFVRIDDENTLTSPEFVGNFFFNTMGNLVQEPRAGLLFIDFERGDMLHLAVDAEIIWDGPQVQAFAGAERLLRFHVREVLRNVGALPLRWTDARPALQLARTGNWEEADKVQRAAALSKTWRPYTITDIVRESESVRSFYLEPADAMGVAAHVPGQFISVRAPGQAVRSYTLSDAPNGRGYRISVKRAGAVSSWLHDHLIVGASLELLGPGGDFTFQEGTKRPAVLLSAGIGITPMIAMLNGLLVNGSRTRHAHTIHFIHGARNRGELAFADHLLKMSTGHRNLRVHVRYSAEREPAAYDSDVTNWEASAGRVDLELVKALLPFDDYDFYLCGPGSFMQQMYEGLRSLNVADERIRFEAFGPASVRRTGVVANRSNNSADTSADTGADTGMAQAGTPVTAVPVQFIRSGITALWDGSAASLLELAESKGVAAPSGCRSGLCGSCAVGLAAGAVNYTRACSADPGDGQVLLCSAIPAAGAAVTLDL